MMDQEKVVKGSEKLREDLGYGLPDRSNVVIEYINSLTDIISMLKKQVPQKAGDCNGELFCIECGNKIKSYYRFCDYCGQAVKLDA